MTSFYTSKTYESWAPVIARIMFGLFFLFAAAAKIPGTSMYSGSVEMTASAGIPFAAFAVIVAFIVEVVTGLALVFGWYARMAATFLIFYVAILTIIFHLHFSSQIEIGFFVDHLLLIAGLFYVSVFGPEQMME